MKTGSKRLLMLGVLLTAWLAAPGRSTAASAPRMGLAITINVHDYAKVDREALTEAQKEATEIFKKTGILSHWIDPDSPGDKSFHASHIQLNILPSVMSDRLPLSDNVMGIAPGTGPDRQWAYVFYHRVKTLTMRHAAYTHENTAKILGHVIAHEIGHLLLNVQSHSATGIMRGDWDRLDLRNAGYGFLQFTPQEAEAIREEVGRRSGRTQESGAQHPN